MHDGHGGSIIWNELAHRTFPDMWADIGEDRENRIIILTGAGDDFLAAVDPHSWSDMSSPMGWDKMYREAKKLVMNYLDIEVPMIAAINGRATMHREFGVLCDIVLAAETAEFADHHFLGGLAPGDGGAILWPMLIGLNRARYFLLMGERLTAARALELGVVNEVLPQDRLLDRAWEIARMLSTKNDLLLRYTRVMLVHGNSSGP